MLNKLDFIEELFSNPVLFVSDDNVMTQFFVCDPTCFIAVITL